MPYADLDTPESVPVRFIEAWHNRDPDALATLFDPDAEFVNVTGLWWHDQHAIRRAHAYGLARIFGQSTLTMTETRVKRLSADVAVVHARMRLTGQTPIAGASQPRARHTIFSFVVHRTTKGWRCASAQNTDIVPHMETNVIDDEGHLRSVSYRDGGGGGVS